MIMLVYNATGERLRVYNFGASSLTEAEVAAIRKLNHTWWGSAGNSPYIEQLHAWLYEWLKVKSQHCLYDDESGTSGPPVKIPKGGELVVTGQLLL